jgi:hypothetical protein
VLQCSVECGEGTTTRAVVCGQLVDGQFVTRHERMCQRQHQPTTAGHCREKACKALWYTTEWSAVSWYHSFMIFEMVVNYKLFAQLLSYY